MLSSAVLIAVILVILIVSAVLWGALLWLGLRWARVASPSLQRVATATVFVCFLVFGLRFYCHSAMPHVELRAMLISVADLVAALVVPYVVIIVMFGAKPLRAFQAWLPTLLSNLLVFLLPSLLIRPYILEAFVIPTNSMAPTIVGRHWEGECPDCGERAYCSPQDGYRGMSMPTMICQNFHVTEPEDFEAKVYSSDRIICNKLISPQRWDVVVFRYPEDPKMMFMKLLVGLPGETIVVEHGAVRVNGKYLNPPDRLKGIWYETGFPAEYEPAFWGSREKPAVLGDDEYFVLGNFSRSSRDSRFWEQGAPGHPPYAVPASYMKGVVTHTYWPPARFRVHR